MWVSNIPSDGTGNALSCAEMAVYLVLACLRSQVGLGSTVYLYACAVDHECKSCDIRQYTVYV